VLAGQDRSPFDKVVSFLGNGPCSTHRLFLPFLFILRPPFIENAQLFSVQLLDVFLSGPVKHAGPLLSPQLCFLLSVFLRCLDPFPPPPICRKVCDWLFRDVKASPFFPSLPLFPGFFPPKLDPTGQPPPLNLLAPFRAVATLIKSSEFPLSFSQALPHAAFFFFHFPPTRVNFFPL